jgi:IS30 family transposase
VVIENFHRHMCLQKQVKMLVYFAVFRASFNQG